MANTNRYTYSIQPIKNKWDPKWSLGKEFLYRITTVHTVLLCEVRGWTFSWMTPVCPQSWHQIIFSERLASCWGACWDYRVQTSCPALQWGSWASGAIIGWGQILPLSLSLSLMNEQNLFYRNYSDMKIKYIYFFKLMWRLEIKRGTFIIVILLWLNQWLSLDLF